MVGLRLDEGPETLADLGPEVRLDNPEVGTFRFRGGHRLWAAPEVPDVSHVPDDHECVVEADQDSLTISGPRDDAGFEKEIEVSFRENELIADHRLRWTGDVPIDAAPWAITQLPPGGVAIMPVAGLEKGSALQADSSLVLWPYTRLDDPRISWRAREVLVGGGPGPQLKLGCGPAPGGLGYLRAGYLFTKRFAPNPANGQPDRGAVGQVYVNDHFVELESVGPLITLEPGGQAAHREIWEIVRCPDLETAIAALRNGAP